MGKMKNTIFVLLALAITTTWAGHLITDCGGIVDLYEEHSCRTVPGNTQLDNEGGSNTPVATCDEVRQVYVDNTCCADNPHKHLSDQSKLYEWCMTDTTHPVLTHTGPATTTLKVGETFTDVGATCTDNCADALSVLKSGVVDTSTPGTYTLTYDCIDKAHNGATQITRAVIVECNAGEVVQNGVCVVPTPPPPPTFTTQEAEACWNKESVSECPLALRPCYTTAGENNFICSEFATCGAQCPTFTSQQAEACWNKESVSECPLALRPCYTTASENSFICSEFATCGAQCPPPPPPPPPSPTTCAWDTPGWTDPHNGHTCAQMAIPHFGNPTGKCANGAFVANSGLTTSNAIHNGNPHLNCCVCGLTELNHIPGWTGPTHCSKLSEANCEYNDSGSTGCEWGNGVCFGDACDKPGCGAGWDDSHVAVGKRLPDGNYDAGGILIVGVSRAMSSSPLIRIQIPTNRQWC